VPDPADKIYHFPPGINAIRHIGPETKPKTTPNYSGTISPPTPPATPTERKRERPGEKVEDLRYCRGSRARWGENERYLLPIAIDMLFLKTWDVVMQRLNIAT
jgi:hypothetical protein